MKLVKRFFEIFWQEEEELCIASWGKVGFAVERFGGVGKKVSGHKSGNTNAEQKTRNIKMRSKASSKCEAEQVKCCMTKSLKK